MCQFQQWPISVVCFCQVLYISIIYRIGFSILTTLSWVKHSKTSLDICCKCESFKSHTLNDYMTRDFQWSTLRTLWLGSVLRKYILWYCFVFRKRKCIVYSIMNTLETFLLVIDMFNYSLGAMQLRLLKRVRRHANRVKWNSSSKNSCCNEGLNV